MQLGSERKSEGPWPQGPHRATMCEIPSAESTVKHWWRRLCSALSDGSDYVPGRVRRKPLVPLARVPRTYPSRSPWFPDLQQSLRAPPGPGPAPGRGVAVTWGARALPPGHPAAVFTFWRLQCRLSASACPGRRLAVQAATSVLEQRSWSCAFQELPDGR